MSSVAEMERVLLEQWRSLSPAGQQEALNYILTLQASKPISPLGKKLRTVRAKIVASGVPMLTPDQIDREKAERRGGYQEI